MNDTELVARRKELSRTLCVELFGNGNVNVAHEFMAPGIVTHGPGALTSQGEGTIIRDALFLRRAMPDLQVSCADQTADGDRVTTHWSATGTHSGPLVLPGETVEPTGNTMTVSETRIDRYDGERIVESWVTRDRHSSRQLVRLIL